MKQTRLVRRGRRTTGNSPGGATSYSLYMYTRVSNTLKNGTRVQSCFTTRNLTICVSKSVLFPWLQEHSSELNKTLAHWSVPII